MRWASFPYQPLDSPVYRRGTCEAGKHDQLAIRAAWVEIISTGDGEDMVIREAWFTCESCHKEMAATAREVAAP